MKGFSLAFHLFLPRYLIQPRQHRRQLTAFGLARMIQRMRRRMHQLVGQRLRQRLDHALRVFAGVQFTQCAFDFVTARALGTIA